MNKQIMCGSKYIVEETGESVVLPCENDPRSLGAVWHENMGEWVIYDK